MITQLKKDSIKTQLTTTSKTPLQIAQEQEVPLERIREVMREDKIREDEIPVRVPIDRSKMRETIDRGKDEEVL